MTQISGRSSGGVMKTPSAGDDDDQNDPLATLQPGSATAAIAGASESQEASGNPNAIDGENPIDAAGGTQTALDVESAAQTQSTNDERQDVSSERTAKRTVGGRSQGIPQAVGEQNNQDDDLSPAAIAARVGRVRV